MKNLALVFLIIKKIAVAIIKQTMIMIKIIPKSGKREDNWETTSSKN